MLSKYAQVVVDYAKVIVTAKGNQAAQKAFLYLEERMSFGMGPGSHGMTIRL